MTEACCFPLTGNYPRPKGLLLMSIGDQLPRIPTPPVTSSHLVPQSNASALGGLLGTLELLNIGALLGPSLSHLSCEEEQAERGVQCS